MKMRFFTLLVALLCLPMISWGQEPVQISTSEELQTFARRVNDGETNLNATLTANIDLNPGITFGESGAESGTPTAWTSIGSESNPYAGTFDGAGHTISGIYINTTEAEYQGLFGYTKGATIQNLGIVNSYINAKDFVGGIAGKINENTVIAGCYNAGIIMSNKSSGSPYVGGLIGASVSSSIISCYNSGTVKAEASYANIGGVIGSSNSDIVTSNCFNMGTITGKEGAYKGSIIGQFYNSEILSSGYLEGTSSSGLGNIYYEVEDAKPMTTAELINAMNKMNEALTEAGHPAVWGLADYDSESQELLLPQLAYSEEAERVEISDDLVPLEVTIIAEGGIVTGAGFYDKDDQVTLVASANEGYEFVNWTDATENVISTDAKYTFTINADITLTANFKEIEDPETPVIPDYPDYYNIYMETCDGVEAALSTKVVREGNSMTFTLETEEGYTDEALTVRFKRSLFGYWETVSPDENGVYQIRNIYTDIYIQVEGVEEENPTGIEEITGAKVYSKDGSIFVFTPAQEQVMIISMSGTVIRNESQIGLKQYTGLQRGVYILCIGEQRFKVRN